MSRRLFFVLLVASLFSRVASLASPGTRDVTSFRTWAYNAAVLGPSQVYGVGGSASDPRILRYRGAVETVDYPPLSIDELAVVGSLARALDGDPPRALVLTIGIKLLAGLASAALALVVLVVVGRRSGAAVGRLAAAAYWANPAVILHGAVLGYLGALAALPAVGALFAALAGESALAGALLAVACLTKPQGVFVAPALVLALAGGSSGRWRRLGSAAVAGSLTTAAIVWPIVGAGALPHMLHALFSLVTDGLLSGNAANLWWLAGYAVVMLRHLSTAGPIAALAARVPILSVSQITPIDYSVADVQVDGLVVLVLSWTAVLAVVGWAMWKARRSGGFTPIVAFAALTVHVYFVLAVQVHENHLQLALPLLAVVAAERRRYRPLFALLSALVFLNLNLFYGLGQGRAYALPRSLTFIDATVLLAIVNIGALIWHLRLFGRECLETAPARPVAGGAEGRL